MITTDSLNTMEIDLLLQKRATARQYVRRRHALRKAVKLGLPAEIVRAVMSQIAELTATWRAARAGLNSRHWDAAREMVDRHCPLYEEMTQ